MESSLAFEDPFGEITFGQDQDSLDFGEFSLPDNMEKEPHSAEMTNYLDSTVVQQESKEEMKSSFVLSAQHITSEKGELENFVDPSESCL